MNVVCGFFVESSEGVDKAHKKIAYTGPRTEGRESMKIKVFRNC